MSEATSVRRLAILLCGYEILKRSDSTRGKGERFVFASPISAYLLDTDQGFVLADTGVSSETIHDPALREHYYTRHGWTPPIVNPEHQLLSQLEHLGVSPREVGRVILTHMHMDHTGNLRHFQHATVDVQRREYDYAFSAKHSPAWFEIDYNLPNLHWQLHDDDWHVLPGLDVIATYGHTPGHQSLVVKLPRQGDIVLVGDVADLGENFAEEILPGEASDDGEALASIRRINRIAAERHAELFIGHDPDFVHRAKLAPEWYE